MNAILLHAGLTLLGMLRRIGDGAERIVGVYFGEAIVQRLAANDQGFQEVAALVVGGRDGSRVRMMY